MSDPIHPFLPGKRSRGIGWRLRDDARPTELPWRWPLERLAGREPLVLDTHVTSERISIDIGYDARHYDAELYVPVYAAQSGEVALAGETASGSIVTIDHGHREWATHYAHLSRLFVAPYLGQRSKRRQRVRAGEVIGYAAKSPIHVLFELWNWTDERGFVPADPLAMFASWGVPVLDVAHRSDAKEAA
jgi:murein DD-endopeptidase MepM/ murein hydrolase activator NlpD